MVLGQYMRKEEEREGREGKEGREGGKGGREGREGGREEGGMGKQPTHLGGKFPCFLLLWLP